MDFKAKLVIGRPYSREVVIEALRVAGKGECRIGVCYENAAGLTAEEAAIMEGSRSRVGLWKRNCSISKGD